MYSYAKDKKFPKRRLIVSLSCVLIAAAAFLTVEYTTKKTEKDTSVFKEDTTPVLSLPSSAAEEKGVQPFAVKAQVVLDYFDGKESEIDSMTKFEGVYRANQGMDYAFNEEAFDVLASFGGEVSEVKDDNIFGKSVTITNEDLCITYQSLSDITVKKGDKVNQKDPIGKAGTNIYNKDLKNHLHIVVEKSGRIIDPKLIFGKTVSEIK